MKEKKRIWFPLLTCLMTVSIVSACGNSGDSDTAPRESNTSAVNGNPETGKKLKISFFNTLGYRPTTAMPPLEEDPIRQKIEKDNNIDLDTILPGENWKDKLNLLISSGQIPDIIGFPDRASAIQYYEKGLIGELDELLGDESDFIGAFDASRWESMKYKGNTIGTPGVEAVGGINGWWINNDWLKKLNLQVPTNSDELLNVMKAFTFDDPDGNGKDDTYGFIGTLSKDGVMGIGFSQVFWMFGVQPNYVDVEDGKVVVHNVDPRMKDALAYIASMVKAGVVDPDWVSTTDASLADKMVKGKVGLLLRDWRSLEPDNTKRMQEVAGSIPDWVEFAPPKGPYGDQILDVKPFQNSLWGISKEAMKDPEKAKRAVELLKYFYTDKEAYSYLAYGIEGKTWNMENGQPKLVDKSTYNEKDMEWRYNYAFVRRADDSVYFDFKNPDITNANQKLNAQYLRDNNVNPRVFDDPNDTMVQDRIKYVNEMFLKFANGKEPIENWDQFVNTMNDKFKLNKVIETYTQQLREDGVLQ
ncbi:hypothetical protein [Paenibacillus sp. GCM10027626]|uniref:hypothetical protein n=1 Tax=Paenibacillus sp. GCM10027626 TaxID=3273411 RepID=UPI003633DC48